MPILKLYHHGLSGGFPTTMANPNPPPRGEVGGWSEAAARRNVRFLWSVRPGELTGIGLAITATVRDCPPTHDDWSKLRRAYIERLRRDGLIRGHWVTEWQRRGVPHLHGAFWLPGTVGNTAQVLSLCHRVRRHWLEVARAYRPVDAGQHVVPIVDDVGWFRYLAKHAARGVHHYQRAADGIPQGWKKTGRMWGHVGDWPTDEAMVIDLDQAGFWMYRRLVRRWRIAEQTQLIERCRTEGWKSGQQYRDAMRQLSRSRRMLKGGDHARSARHGISGWIPMDVQLRLLAAVAAAGHQITS